MPPITIDAQPMSIDAQPLEAAPTDTPDVIGQAKSWLTQEPQPGAHSAFGEPEIFAPVGSAIREAGRLLLPGSIPEATLQAGIGWAGGKILPGIIENALRTFRAVRPLAKEVAQEGLAKLLPEEALSAKAFYEAAGQSDKAIPVATTIGGRNIKVNAVVPHTFQEAQSALQNLRLAANKLEEQGRTAAAKIARDHMGDIEGQIEQVFPGFKAAQKGYAKLKDIGLVQEMVNNKGPLRALEMDIAKGQVMGPEGLVMKGGGRATRWLQADELKEAKSIMEKLGPEPGENIFRNLVEGRAIGHLLGAVGGGALGMKEGGWQGATAGAATGLMVPRMLNWMIAQGMRHPTTRAFLKEAIQSKGLNRPEFWGMLSQVGARLGMNMLKDPETAQEEAQAQAQAQAQQQQAQQMQMMQAVMQQQEGAK